MRASRVTFREIIEGTDYFQNELDSILQVLQPSYLCLDLVIKIILDGPDGCGKRLLLEAAAKHLNLAFCEDRVADLFDENIVGTEKKVRAAISKYATSAPCIIYWSGYELFTRLEEIDLNRIEYCIRESLEDLMTSGTTKPIAFAAGTSEFDKVYKTILSEMFQHNIHIRPASNDQAKRILTAISNGFGLKSEPLDLLPTLGDEECYIGNLMDVVSRTMVGESSDSSLSEIEGTRWTDVGGLNEVKNEIIDAIKLSIDIPQLKKSGLRRTGILLFGPPGTGKTLLAKAVATECQLKFINVKGPELLNEYVGQSEDNVRKLFQRARDSSPAVIFFDEIDSLAPNRGKAGDSGGVMDRIVSQLLAEIDGVGKSDDVFVIGATNRVDLVDPSLLRPGRFDKVLEVPLPKTKEGRMQILRALTRKMEMSDDVDLEKIEALMPADSSGADFQGLCSRTLHKTFDRCVKKVESGLIDEEDIEVITTMDDFLSNLIE